jgi:hypothetical protein
MPSAFPTFYRIGVAFLFVFLTFNAGVLVWNVSFNLGVYGSTNIPLFLGFISPITAFSAFIIGSLLSLTVTKWFSKAGLDKMWGLLLATLVVVIVACSILLISTPEN